MKKLIQNTYSLSSICHDNIFTDGDWVESKDQDQNGQVRLLQLADIGTGQFLDKSKRYMSLKKAYELKCTFIKDGDILIARMPDPIGRACLFKRNGLHVTVVDICILRPNLDIVHPHWLLWFINSTKFLNQIKCYISGTTRKRISRKNLDKIQFDLPPLPEQKRIANILDKADNLRKMRQESIKKLDELSQSIFLDMFGDPLTNPKGWEVISVGDLLIQIEGGWSPVCEKEPRCTTDSWAVLSLGSISTGVFLETKNKRTKPNTPPRIEIEIKKGDLLFCRKNTYGKVGITALVDHSTSRLMFPDTIFRLKLIEPFLTVYLHFILNTKLFRSQKVQSLANGTSGSMPNIPKNKLRTILIPRAPDKLIREFNKKIEIIKELKRNNLNSLNLKNNLFNSLMQKAFKGELNTQEQLDEGAVSCQTSHSSSQPSQESSMMH